MGYINLLKPTSPRILFVKKTAVKCTTTTPQKTQVIVNIQVHGNQVIMNGKTYTVPVMMESVVEENKDVFEGQGKLLGELYHIHLDNGYIPQTVAVNLQPANKAELKWFIEARIMLEVKQTEWINSIVHVQKLDRSLCLCLEPKDLNKAIKRNQWYMKTIDDVLSQLAGKIMKSKNDV